MLPLTPEMHSELTSYVIKLLNSNKITKDTDFIREDSKKLSIITNIGEPADGPCHLLKQTSDDATNYSPEFEVISEIKQHLFDANRMLPLDAYSHFVHLSGLTHSLSTHIERYTINATISMRIQPLMISF